METYVLRFWESQFPQLKPNKSGTGQRLYRRRDVEMALEIKRLVHAEGYTLAGARAVLGQELRRSEQGKRAADQVAVAEGQSQRRDAVAAAIGRARAELREIAGMLAAKVAPAEQPAENRRAAAAASRRSTNIPARCFRRRRVAFRWAFRAVPAQNAPPLFACRFFRRRFCWRCFGGSWFRGAASAASAAAALAFSLRFLRPEPLP